VQEPFVPATSPRNKEFAQTVVPLGSARTPTPAGSKPSTSRTRSATSQCRTATDAWPGVEHGLAQSINDIYGCDKKSWPNNAVPCGAVSLLPGHPCHSSRRQATQAAPFSAAQPGFAATWPNRSPPSTSPPQAQPRWDEPPAPEGPHTTQRLHRVWAFGFIMPRRQCRSQRAAIECGGRVSQALPTALPMHTCRFLMKQQCCGFSVHCHATAARVRLSSSVVGSKR
jgi:hypothetical protein